MKAARSNGLKGQKALSPGQRPGYMEVGKCALKGQKHTCRLDAQIWRDMSILADSEPMMKRVAKYLRKLVAEKEDPTLMTKEEFFAKIERAEQQAARGEYSVLQPGEDLTTHLRRLGYDI